jgi:AraC family transcriptional activator of pobA
MQVLSEIDELFILLQCPFRSLRNEFIAYKLEDYDASPHLLTIPLNRALFFQVVLNLGESMQIVSNESTLTTRVCTLSFFSPFHITAFTQVSHMNGLCFMFSESFVNRSFQNEQFHKDFPFFWSNQNHFFMGKENASTFLGIGEKIVTEYQNRGPFSENIIRDYLHVFLLEAKRIVQSTKVVEDNSSEYRLLQQFYALVNNSFPMLRSVERAAGILHVTPAHLWLAVKKLTNQAPLEIINHRVITEAKSLLLQSDMTISEIGYSLQFREKSHFTRFFKNIAGMTPVEYVKCRSAQTPVLLPHVTKLRGH